MNANSIMAWNSIKDSPKLSELRRRVATSIFHNPGQTANELATCSSLGGLQQHSITPRFKELEVMGIIVRKEPRRCSITGHMADTYEINPNITEDTIRPFKRPQRYRAPTLLPIRTREGLNEAIRQGDVILLYIGGVGLSSMEEGQIAMLQQGWDNYSMRFKYYRCRLPEQKW